MQHKIVTSFMEATGVIEYNMTNNYMFRYILQKNQKVLKGLICSLLQLNPHQIKSIEIKNPIDLAGDVTGKEFILDIHVMLNDNTLINLEMQVANEHNWPERSLMYLCRAFDHLYSDQDYTEALPVYHIGFLDYTLFPDHPEFFATYKLINVKNHHLYSSKFSLSVVDLTQTQLATAEDKEYNLDYWARIFKVQTWEELKMLAKNNEYLQEAADSLYQANADELIREQCRARKDAERVERTLKRDLLAATQENTILKEKISILEENNYLLEKAYDSAIKNYSTLEKKHNTLEKNYNTLEKNYNSLESKYNTVVGNTDVLQKHVGDLLARIQALESK